MFEPRVKCGVKTKSIKKYEGREERERGPFAFTPHPTCHCFSHSFCLCASLPASSPFGRVVHVRSHLRAPHDRKHKCEGFALLTVIAELANKLALHHLHCLNAWKRLLNIRPQFKREKHYLLDKSLSNR